MRIRHLAVLSIATALFLPTTPAQAAELGSGLGLSGGATIVSDYRFRGISLSDEDPALQGTLNVDHESGVYAGVWGSLLDDTSLYGNGELDLYAGWRGDVASGTTIDLGFLYYFYPDGASLAGDSDFAEPFASITHDFGPVTGKLGAAYAWEQGATGGGDNAFIYTDWTARIPATPVTLRAHLGHSNGALSPTGDYFEWAPTLPPDRPRSASAMWTLTLAPPRILTRA